MRSFKRKLGTLTLHPGRGKPPQRIDAVDLEIAALIPLLKLFGADAVAAIHLRLRELLPAHLGDERLLALAGGDECS